MTAAQIVDFVSGAALLLTNEYEHELLLARTGLDEQSLLRPSTGDGRPRVVSVATTRPAIRYLSDTEPRP